MEGLQQPHMEDVVEVRALRKPQEIGHLPNALSHLKWSCVTRTQLTLWPVLQRVGRPVEEAKPDPISDRKLQLAVVLVLVVLSVLLSLEKTLTDVGEEGVAVTE